MRTLFLIRHAKSSWKQPDLRDHDRPLNKRGKKNLPLMTQRITAHGWRCDRMVTSTALRAITTAQALSETLLQGKDYSELSELYRFDDQALIEQIRKQPDQCQSLALVGHNPAITELLNWLTCETVDNVPTCGIAKLSLNIDGWSDLTRNCASLDLLDYPKREPK